MGTGPETALWLLAGAQSELALFAGVGLLIFGLDDLLIDMLWIRHVGWRAATVYRRHERVTMATLAPPRTPGRIAIFIGAWDEAAVIGTTLATAVARWGEADYRIYVATYPNDPATHAAIAAVREDPVAATRIRVVTGERPGPTTKAEALNRAWTTLLDDEAREGVRAKAILLHDAEDFVHRDELRLLGSLIERFALVQIPVRPLKRGGMPGVAGHYLDEFAEAHGKQMVVREAMGASVPCAGTGCAIDRDMLARLAAETDGMPFDGESLTEDYELGLRIGRHGGRGILARVLDRPGGAPVAVEAYFPHIGAMAVRQKARWVTGIALAGWDRMGWQGGFRESWMRLRDRSVLLAAIVLAATYVALLLTLIETAIAWAYGREGALLATASSPLAIVLVILLLWRLAMRALLVNLTYGWREALRSVPRVVVSNLISIAAATRALRQYSSGAAPRWDKTPHSLPEGSAK